MNSYDCAFPPSSVINDSTQFSSAIKILLSKRCIKSETNPKSDVIVQMQRVTLRLGHLLKYTWKV